jgi:hypothetical protein
MKESMPSSGQKPYSALGSLTNEAEEDNHPELRSWWIFRFMIFWVFPIIKIANTRQLLEEDVWKVPNDQNVMKSFTLVWESWLREKERAKIAGRPPKLFYALVKAFMPTIIIAFIFQMSFFCCQLAQPFLVGELVSYVRNGEGGIERGLGLAFGLGAVALVSSITLTMTLYTLRRLGVAIRSSIMYSVYHQALRLTSSSRMQSSVGK